MNNPRAALRETFVSRDACVLWCLVAAEATIVWLFARAVLAAIDGRDRTAFGVVFGLIALGAFLPLLLERLDLWERPFQIAMTVAIVGSTAIALKQQAFPALPWFDSRWLREVGDALTFQPGGRESPVLGTIALALYAWWRGRLRQEADADAAQMMLRVGTPLLFGVLVLDLAVHPERDDRARVLGVLLYFATTLIAIGLTRTQNQIVDLRSAWRAVLPVALVIGAGTIVTAAMSRQVVDAVFWVLWPVVWTLAVIARVLVLAIAILTLAALSPFLFLLSGLSLDFHGFHLDSTSIRSGSAVEHAAGQLRRLPADLRYLISALVLILLFTGATRYILRMRRRPARRAGDPERRAIHWSSGWRDWMLALRDALRRSDRHLDDLDALRRDPVWQHTVRIRETYREFLRWNQRSDSQHGRGTTARERAQAAPAATLAATTTLIELYEPARYGHEPATRDQADRAAAAMRHIRGASPGR